MERGIDKNGIVTYLFQDDQVDRISRFVRELYNYSSRRNPVSKEESIAFLDISSAEILQLLETRRKDEQGKNWKPGVVQSNDGQYGPLQAVAMSRYGLVDVIKYILWSIATHTDINRGSNTERHNESERSLEWGIRVFLKHMLGVKDRYITAFQQIGRIDYTSGGGRLAHKFIAVAKSHADRMRGKDPNSNLVAVTNGAVPEEMAAVYRREFNNLKQLGKISPAADFERPTSQEMALVKIECKKRLNEANIKTADGGVLHVDIDKPLIGYVRRLVPEKAGRQRAFTDDNIWMLPQLGYNAVLWGNNQQTPTSQKLADELIDLERRIATEKKKRPQEFPGNYQFVETFTREQKILYLAALDDEIQDSDNNEANGAWEEDGAANGAKVGTGTWRTGVLADQGLLIDYDHPGKGNILMPKEDTARSWLEDVYFPEIESWNGTVVRSRFLGLDSIKGTILDPNNGNSVWEPFSATQVRVKQDRIKDLETALEKISKSDLDRIGPILKRHLNRNPQPQEDFYKNSALGPRLNRIAYYLLTSATYLREYDKVLARQEKQAQVDGDTEAKIVEALGNDQATIRGILYDGRNGVTEPFKFEVLGQKQLFPASGKGLRAFLKKETELETRFGSDALLIYYIGQHFQKFLKELFLGTPAAGFLDTWIRDLENDDSLSVTEKEIRLRGFIEGLMQELEKQFSKKPGANAAMITPGGIKFEHFDIQRHGGLMTNLVNDKALENMLLKAQGLYGVIVGIIPIPNLLNFIQ